MSSPYHGFYFLRAGINVHAFLSAGFGGVMHGKYGVDQRVPHMAGRTMSICNCLVPGYAGVGCLMSFWLQLRFARKSSNYGELSGFMSKQAKYLFLTEEKRIV